MSAAARLTAIKGDFVRPGSKGGWIVLVRGAMIDDGRAKPLPKTAAAPAVLAAAALMGAVALSACAATGPVAEARSTASEADRIEDGRRLAALHCAACHAPGAAGESRNPDAPALRRLAERYPAALLADAFPQRMAVGHPAMPEFGFDDAEIDALFAYLLSIQERRGA